MHISEGNKLTENGMAPTESARSKRPQALFARPCRRGSCLFWRWFPLQLAQTTLFPLLLLLSILTKAQGSPFIPPFLEKVHRSPSQQHDRVSPVQNQGQLTPFQTPEHDGRNPCRDYDANQRPHVLYTDELFARMLTMDEEKTGSFVDHESMEKIITTCSLNEPSDSHTLTFNINWLGDTDNITTAKVLVVTNSASGKNGCQPQLKKSRLDSMLPCENRPFKIKNLAAVDVTSLLTEQLGQRKFRIYVKRLRHMESAVLVVFNDLTPQQLFKGTELKRCKNSVGEAADVCRRKLTKRYATGQKILDNQIIQREDSEGDSLTGKEISTRRVPRAIKNGHQSRNSDKSRNTQDSSQHFAFQTPAQLISRLNDRRKRFIGTNNSHSEELDSLTRVSDGCQVQDFLVDPFEDLGLTDFITPLLLHVGQCSGECPPILQPNNRVSMYSYIMSLMHTRDPSHGHPPRCQPSRFQSFSVMRFQGKDVVIERWHNARVTECTCV